ncbi:MAG TPA: 30S ribosomal protein S2 [Candidatus Nanopelagicales bacterium]
MAVVTMRQMLESGVHFGHQTRRWNPKMKRFILTERNGIYIIDLTQSLTAIDRAYSYVKDTVSRGGTVMFVGTKKQAQEAVAEQATRVGMPYVNERWLGGMLTNFQTVHKRLQRLKELEQIDFDDVAGSGMTKKELLVLRREKDKLERTLGGIRDMARTPSAVWVVDTNKEAIAVGEARKLGIPVIAILDSNCDPDVVDFPIPGNDDAIRAVALLTRVIADAVAEGLVARASGGTVAAEPLAEWEAELLAAHQAEQAAEVVAVEAVAEAVVADVVAEEAVIEAVAAEAVAEEAVAEAVVAEAVADAELAEAAAGYVSAEEAQAAVDVAAADEVIAEEAVAEALVAEAVAEEAVAEAVVAEAVAEEAVIEAVVAEDVAAAVEAEADERTAE